jgi:glycerol-3-phosphate acyltransferase PlsX
MLKIGIDIMGGDYAPRETTLGAIDALKELPSDVELVLIGDRAAINQHLSTSAHQNISIVHTTEVIEMADNPTRAIQQKPDSSISRGFQLLKEGKLDAFASAGNTGAMLVGAMFSVKPISGISRPCIASLVPKENGEWGLILDVGVNADCKPEQLQQFAILGTLYARHILHIENPSVGLMSIGEEEEKGSMLVKEAHQLMKSMREINFLGNVEGRDLFNDKADVIVCDGFTGNVILKQAESFYNLLKNHLPNSDGGLGYFDLLNYEDYGGTPILGVNSTVIIGHGISHAKAIKNMVLLAYECAHVKLSEKIAQAFSKETAGSLTP